jgi:hypothetical protein
MSPEATPFIVGGGGAPYDGGMTIPERFRAGMDYAAYEEALRLYDATPLPADASDDDRAHKSFATINLQRASRISRSYVPGEEITALITGSTGAQLWGVLSEVWCGDSVQVIPYLARIASLRPDIMFRILLRDVNPDIMDCYLTAGKRSIPKVIVWDAGGNELFTWGARPAGAQAVVDEALAEKLPKQQRLERLHLWYGRDRGRSIEGELAVLLRAGR